MPSIHMNSSLRSLILSFPLKVNMLLVHYSYLATMKPEPIVKQRLKNILLKKVKHYLVGVIFQSMKVVLVTQSSQPHRL